MNTFGLGVVLNFTDKFSVGVGTATTAFNGLSQAIDAQSTGITSTLTSLCNTVSSIGSQLTTAFTTPVSAITGTFLKYGIARASFVENATLAYQTLMGDQKEASAYLQELMDFAKTTPFTYETLAGTAQQFLAYGANMDLVLKSASDGGTKFTGILQALGDAAGGLGASESFISEASDAILKMKTDLDSGSSTTIRLQQLEDRGLQVSRILGNLWGVENAGSKTISDYMQKNNITYDQFLTSLTEGIEKGTEGVNGTTAAMSGLMSNIKNTWTGALDTWKSSLKTAGKELMDYDENTGTYGFLVDMTKALNRCSTAVKTFAPLLQPLVTDIRNMMSKGSEYLENLTKKWGDVSDDTKQKISRIIEVLVLLGPTLTVVGKAGGVLTSVFSSFGGSAVKSIKFIFSPLGILTGLVVGLVSAFVYLYNTNDEFRENIKRVMGSITDSWSKFSEPLKESLGKIGDACLDLFNNLTTLLTPAFEGLFKSFGNVNESSGSILVAVFSALASAIQTVSNGIAFLNQQWEKLPTETQDKIIDITGNVLLLALGLTALFKVFKSLSGAKTVIDNLPFIGSKSKDKTPSSSGGLSGGILSNPKAVAKSMASIAIIVGGVAVLVTAVGALMTIPYFSQFLATGVTVMGKLLKVIIPLASVAGVMALLVTLTDKLGISAAKSLENLGAIAILIGGMDAIVTALGFLMSDEYFMQFLSTGASVLWKLLPVIPPLTAVVGVLALLITALDLLQVGTEDALKGLANIAIILGGFDVLVTAVGALDSIPGFDDFINSGIETLTKLFTTMKVFTTAEFWLMLVAAIALGVVSPAIVAEGLAGIAIIIGGMEAIVTAFGALASIPGFDDFVQRGGDLLALTFEQIGKAIGSIIGGIGEGVTSALPAMGHNLSEFAESLKPFFEIIGNAPVEGISSFLVAFGEFMVMMTGSEVLSVITGGIDLTGLGEQLNSFAEDAEPFFIKVATYPALGLKKASQVFEALGGLGNYNFKTGGFAQMITGETNLTSIGVQLKSFAPNGKTFFTYVASYNNLGLKKAPQVFEAISGIGNYDYKTGGLAQLITGETNLTTIGIQLKSFAPNGKVFFAYVATYNNLGLKKAPRVFEAISGIGDYDYKTGGLAQLVTGETNLSNIGTQLSAFGKNAKDFFTDVALYPMAGIKKAKQVLEAVSVAGSINFKSGGIFEWIVGSNSIDTFGTKLSDFGTNVKPFFDKMTEISYQSVLRGNSVISLLNNINGISNRTGGLLQAITGEANFGSLGEQLASFGYNMKLFLKYASEVNDEGMKKTPKIFESAEGAKALTSIANVNDKDKLSSLGLGLSMFLANAKDFFNSSVEASNNSSIVTLANNLDEFLQVIKDFDNDKLTTTITNIETLTTNTKAFSTGLTNVATETKTNTSSIETALTTGINSCTDVLNTFASNGGTVGSNLMSNIAFGITNNAWQVKQALQNSIGSIDIKIPTSSTAPGTSKIPKLATGGVTKSPTIALLGEGKDNEAVLPLNNDTFANIARGIVNQNVNNVKSGDNVTNDYSVVFSAGSIQVVLSNSSDEEIEQVAERIENIILRRQEIRKMANRE